LSRGRVVSGPGTSGRMPEATPLDHMRTATGRKAAGGEAAPKPPKSVTSSPPDAKPMATARQFRVFLLIGMWMCISIGLIMYNKWLLSYKGYRFPLAMTMTHQAFTATVAHVTCRLGFMSPPRLTFEQLKERIAPIALLFAASIALSNFAVSHLTVPFMQMLKASIPTFSLLIGFATGMEHYDTRLLGTVVGIGLGVMIASLGEVEFVWEGFIVAIVGLITEAARLVLTQRLLQGQDIKFNAITGNYYTAPIAFATLAVPFVFFELDRYQQTVDLAEIGVHIIGNGLLAAMLNVSVFVVLKETSAVTYGIAGQVKDWMNILIAIPIFGNKVTWVQFMGYSMAVTGVFYYKKIRTKMALHAKEQAEKGNVKTEELTANPSEAPDARLVTSGQPRG